MPELTDVLVNPGQTIEFSFVTVRKDSKRSHHRKNSARLMTHPRVSAAGIDLKMCLPQGNIHSIRLHHDSISGSEVDEYKLLKPGDRVPKRFFDLKRREMAKRIN